MLIVNISMLCKYWKRNSVHVQTSSCIRSLNSAYRLCCWHHVCSTFKLPSTRPLTTRCFGMISTASTSTILFGLVFEREIVLRKWDFSWMKVTVQLTFIDMPCKENSVLGAERWRVDVQPYPRSRGIDNNQLRTVYVPWKNWWHWQLFDSAMSTAEICI